MAPEDRRLRPRRLRERQHQVPSRHLGIIPGESQATFLHVKHHRMRSPVSPGNRSVDRKTFGATGIDEVKTTLMLHEEVSVDVSEREHY